MNPAAEAGEFKEEMIGTSRFKLATSQLSFRCEISMAAVRIHSDAMLVDTVIADEVNRVKSLLAWSHRARTLAPYPHVPVIILLLALLPV